MTDSGDKYGYLMSGNEAEAERCVKIRSARDTQCCEADGASGNRLNLQHWMLKKVWWHGRSQLWAPPDLDSSSTGKTMHILDSGCGTGRPCRI